MQYRIRDDTESLTRTEKLTVCLSQVTKTKKSIKEETKKQTPVPNKAGLSSKSVKVVRMEPERRWRKGFVEQTGLSLE